MSGRVSKRLGLSAQAQDLFQILKLTLEAPKLSARDRSETFSAVRRSP